MRLDKILALVPIATVMLVAALPAQAQGSFGFGFSKYGRNSAFGFGFSAPIYRQSCYVPGHYETICQQVWVAGCARRVWVEPVYETCTDPCGNGTRVIVRAGYWRVIEDGGHYESRYVQVWIPGRYV